MEVKVEDLSFNELIDLFKAMQEFVEFLETEENRRLLSQICDKRGKVLSGIAYDKTRAKDNVEQERESFWVSS